MNLDLARWQFASTSIYHFLFVPVTIGLAFLVALLETGWYRNGDAVYLRLARFFGALLLINVAIAVVTGLIQEFEFGMNWSVFSRLVGNVFGGPLAFEGLVAFFLESTFLGLWIFGWNRLSKRAHLACIWLVSAGTVISAVFIMAANSWMQHPVGYKLNSAKQPVLTNFFALFTNPVFLWGFTHVILASLVTGALIMLGVSAWHLRRKSEVDAFRRTAVISLVVLLLSTPIALFVGSELGVVEATYQPMKIAAAEAQWNTCQPCSLLAVPDRRREQRPDADADHLDPLAAVHPRHQPSQRQGAVGLNELNAEYQKEYGPGNYVPNVFIQYWSMRVMAYLAALVMALRALGRVAAVPAPARPRQMVPAHRALGHHHAVPDEHRRVDADRERPAALDRPGSAEDRPRGFAVRVGHGHLDLDRRFLPRLHCVRDRRHVAHDPLQPQAARPRPDRQAGERRCPVRRRSPVRSRTSSGSSTRRPR